MKNKSVLAPVFMPIVVLIAIAGILFLVHLRAQARRMAVRVGVTNSPPLALSSTPTYTALMPGSASQGGSAAGSSEVTPRRENPYAVVRDGICAPNNVSGGEQASRKKWEALLRDPYWQSIFSGVNPEKLDVVKTSVPLYRFVTYWKMENGQAIHWTGRKILIPEGTRVFTDGGSNMYLCACGNQVAAVLPPDARAIVLPPQDEPSVTYLVPREPELFPVASVRLPGEIPLAPSELAAMPAYSKSDLIPSAPSMYVPPLFIGGSSPGGGSGEIPEPPSQPVVTPEPGTLSLTLIGIGVFAFVSLRRKRRLSTK